MTMSPSDITIMILTIEELEREFAQFKFEQRQARVERRRWKRFEVRP